MPAALILAAALAAHSPPVDHPKTYLASITGIRLAKNEYVDGFKIDTWGVIERAVCHFPPGWDIDAGSSADPTGQIKGEGSLGVTYLDPTRLSELNELVLITLVGPVQARDIGHDGTAVFIPATFKGHVSIGTYGVDGKTRKARLTSRNIKLVPASRCPPLRD